MNVPEKHREVAHAWVDGADIQCLQNESGEWKRIALPGWYEVDDYRIDPKCDYALAKIPEKHREVYLAWCDGAEVEVLSSEGWAKCNPIWEEHFSYRIKPKIIKRWKFLMIKGTHAWITTDRMTGEAAQDFAKCNGYISRKIPGTEQEFPE